MKNSFSNKSIRFMTNSNMFTVFRKYYPIARIVGTIISMSWVYFDGQYNLDWIHLIHSYNTITPLQRITASTFIIHPKKVCNIYNSKICARVPTYYLYFVSRMTYLQFTYRADPSNNRRRAIICRNSNCIH